MIDWQSEKLKSFEHSSAYKEVLENPETAPNRLASTSATTLIIVIELQQNWIVIYLFMPRYTNYIKGLIVFYLQIKKFKIIYKLYKYQLNWCGIDYIETFFKDNCTIVWIFEGWVLFSL